MPTQGYYQRDPNTGALVWVPFRDLSDPANVEPNRAPPRNRGDAMDQALVDNVPLTGDWWSRFGGSLVNPFAQVGAGISNWWNMVEPGTAPPQNTPAPGLDSVQTAPLSASQWNMLGQLGDNVNEIDPQVMAILRQLAPSAGVSAPTLDLEEPTFTADPSRAEIAAFYEAQNSRMEPYFARLEEEVRRLDTSDDRWGNFFRMLGEMGAAESADPGSIGKAAWAAKDRIDEKRREAQQILFEIMQAREGMSERGALARANVSSGEWEAGERTRAAGVDTRNTEAQFNTDARFRIGLASADSQDRYRQMMAQVALDNLQNVEQARMQVGLAVRQAATGRNWKRQLSSIAQTLGIDMDFNNYNNDQRREAAATLIARISSNRQALQIAPVVLSGMFSE